MNYPFLLSGIPVLYLENVFSLTDDEYKQLTSTEFYRTNQGNSLSVSSNILDNEKLIRVKSIMTDIINDYVTNTLEISNKFYLTNTWVTKNSKGDVHTSHAHPNSILSAVYYIKARSGNISLSLTPQWCRDFNFEFDVIRYNEYNSRSWTFNVTTGSVLLFPSWMIHEVSENTDEEDRYVLGVNSFFNGALGNDKNLNKVTI